MTTATAFAHVLVPYDDSEAAHAALAVAIELARHGARLTVLTVADETAVIAQSASGMTPFDPTPALEALEADALALSAAAAESCSRAGVSAETVIAHDMPVSGITAAVDAHDCDLVVMGTHGRTGLARMFLGSFAAGVMRMSRVPVLTVRAENIAATTFGTALLALDNSEPADAAAVVAAKLAHDLGTAVVACEAVDLDRVFDDAAAYGFLAGNVETELRAEASATVAAALARAALPADTPVDIREGKPAETIVDAAAARAATLIVAGTHGRRGLQRFVLGSVAETLVRSSPVPVLIVPART